MSLTPDELYKQDKNLVHLDEKGQAVSINLAELVYHLYKRVNELETIVCENQVELSTPRTTSSLDDQRFEMVSKTLDAVMTELEKMKDAERRERVNKITNSKIPIKKVKI